MSTKEEKVTFAKVLPRNSTEEMGLEGCYELLQMCAVSKHVRELGGID